MMITMMKNLKTRENKAYAVQGRYDLCEFIFFDDFVIILNNAPVLL